MYNFRKVSLILSAAVLLFFSSCRSASPETAAEELCSADRQTADGSCCLSFSDGSASFTAKRSGEALNISGEYFADEQKLSIVTKDCGTVSFSYRFQDGRLFLEYSGLEICLDKKAENS